MNKQTFLIEYEATTNNGILHSCFLTRATSAYEAMKQFDQKMSVKKGLRWINKRWFA